MSGLHTKIYDLIENYRNPKKNNPENLYIGRKTWIELRHELEPFRMGSFKTFSGMRQTFEGLNVFVVDADEHLNVG